MRILMALYSGWPVESPKEMFFLVLISVLKIQFEDKSSGNFFVVAKAAIIFDKILIRNFQKLDYN